MYPTGNGSFIIEAFKQGLIFDADSFNTFVKDFNDKNFGYDDYELITEYSTRAYEIQDTLNRYADYSYIINLSKMEVNGLPANYLGIYKYDKNDILELYKKPEEKTVVDSGNKEKVKEAIKTTLALANISKQDSIQILKELITEY